MVSRKTYKTRGIVLRHTPIGEADRVLTLLTSDLGKVRAVARGVRRVKSKLAGHVEPFTYVSVSISYGRTLDVISEAQTIRSFGRLRENLLLISEAVYLSELADAFSNEQEPTPEIFHLLIECLDALESTDDTTRLIRWFEIQLLDATGFRPELYECVECRLVLEPGDYIYNCSRGGLLCNGCKVQSVEVALPLSINANKTLRYYQRNPLLNVLKVPIPKPVSDEIGRVLRAYSRYVLERELKSVGFMDLLGK